MNISIINIFIFFLWLCSALFDYSHFSHLWQLKEYRLDRFRDFLHTKKGKQYFLQIPLVWKVLFCVVAVFVPLNHIPLVKLLILVGFFLDVVYAILSYTHKQLKRPIVTPKIILLLLSSMFVEGSLFLFFRDWTFLLFIVPFRYFLFVGMIFVFQFPTGWAKNIIIYRAKQRLLRYPKLLVIGITGSFGKTSTKEFLSQILEGTYRLVKTPQNVNTDIGIAKFILKTDFRDVQVFVVEMGAYRVGEIQRICNIVSPKIGILTAVNEQHLSLFGSINNTKITKGELLHALPDDGLAVVNADNAHCRDIVRDVNASVQMFGLDPAFHPDCLIVDVKQEKQYLVCSFQIGGERFDVSPTLWGEHNAHNLASVILVAHYLNISFDDIRDRIEHLESVRGTLKMYHYGRSIVIDDSYNSNPEGFRSALNVLTQFGSSRARVVITRGMLELGETSDEKHEIVGGEIAYSVDHLILISRDFEEPLRRGVGSKFHTDVRIIDSPERLLSYVRTLYNQQSVILVENRIPVLVKNELMSSESLLTPEETVARMNGN